MWNRQFFSLTLTLLASFLSTAHRGTVAAPHGDHDLEIRTWNHKNHWVTTWGSMPQLTEPANLPPAPFNETGRVFFNTTIRQTVQVSTGAEYIRLRISNAFGGSDLPITAVTIALPRPGENGGAGTSAIRVETLQSLTFSGDSSFTVPVGALVVSDPIKFKIKSQSVVTVSIYLAKGQETNDIASHPGSRTSSWFSFGNYVDAEDLTDASTQKVEHWYFISAIEAWAPRDSAAFVIVGDSITDGRGSDDNKNNRQEYQGSEPLKKKKLIESRWPDLLLKKMQSNRHTSNIAIVNQAAGGNRILNDGLGPNALSRIDRDVLTQSGVKYAMIYEGVNDIGTADNTTEAQEAIGDRLIAAYKQIASRVHTHGIPVFAATITPFIAPNSTIQPYSDPIREETRKRVNAWIRHSNVFDAVIDFDKIVADPEDSSQLNPKYNSGDYLHLNVDGFQALADAFPLFLFKRFANGVDSFQ
ncbi:hypothetical protein VTO42DRAFT_8366 [Malbranchea cinnamomea]